MPLDPVTLGIASSVVSGIFGGGAARRAKRRAQREAKRLQNKLNLNDNTILIRLALINLTKNLPSNEEVLLYKAALMRPGEFDEFLKESMQLEVTA